MGILDQMLSGGAPQGSQRAARNRKVNSTLAMGVLAALAVKAMRDRQRPAEDRSFEAGQGQSQAQGQGQGQQSGGGDILGGLGGLLGGVGAAGAIGSLVKAMQQRGLETQAHSWVGHGSNQPIQPNQLADALDDDTLLELEEHTGLSRPQLLTQLAQELPEAVNQATPDGQLPTDQDLQRVTGS